MSEARFSDRKKAKFCLTFFDFHEKPCALKKPEFQQQASNQSNCQAVCLVSIIRNLLCRLEVAAAELRPFVLLLGQCMVEMHFSSDGYYRCVAS